MSIRTCHVALQAGYEAGNLSYPRAGADGYSSAVAKSVATLTHDFGLEPRHLLPTWAPSAESPHESPHPTPLDQYRRIRSALAADGIALDLDQATSRWFRQALRFASATPDEIADPPEDVPHWARALRFTRPSRISPELVEPEERSPPAGLTLYEQDEIAFRALLDLGLGEPSTLADHATRLASSGLLAKDGSLTTKGECQADETHELLSGMAFARHVDGVLSHLREDASQQPELVDLLQVVFRDEWPAVATALRQTDGQSARAQHDRRQSPDTAARRQSAESEVPRSGITPMWRMG